MSRPEGTVSSRQAGLLGALLVVILIALIAGYLATQKTITVTIDGRTSTVRTHQRAVSGLLRELGLSLLPQDILLPSPDTALTDGDALLVRHALSVNLEADGRRSSFYSQADSVAELLREANLTLSPRDLLSVNGRVLAAESLRQVAVRSAVAAPALAMAASAGPKIALARSELSDTDLPHSSSPLQVTLRRAVPIRLRDGAAETAFLTVADTIGEALRQEGIPIYLGDLVTPPLGTPVSPDIAVIVQRARPVTILVDGQTIHTRTQARQLEQALAEEGVVLANKDYSSPEPISPVVSDMTVQVTRVREEIVTEEEAIPYNTIWQAAPEMEIDERTVAQAGVEGVFKRTIHIVYENGVETKRLLEREWVDREPTTKIIAFGTKVVLHEVMTESGPIQYWRKMRVYATWYNASHGWWARDSRYYGMTRTGAYATKGIIAVDPLAIRLYTRMYVPGYGFGAAEDTGGLIKGMRIDLAFDEGDPDSHSLGWVTIYLLPPVPPSDQIPWILPDYPKER